MMLGCASCKWAFLSSHFKIGSVSLCYIQQIEKLQQLLRDPEELKYNFSKFEPIPVPVDPTVIIEGIRPNTASLFKVTHPILKVLM